MTTDQFLTHIKSKLPVKGRLKIVEFFFAFSRFECALKASNFTLGDQDRVQANWNTFVNSIQNTFDRTRTDELNEAVTYILDNPPRIQAMDAHNNLRWRARVFQPHDNLTTKLKLHICDIRNNLFHGGKFYGRYEEDVSRNYILLDKSIIILNEWLNLSEAVRQNFLEPIN
jgi:hypothetical protein